MLRNSEFVDNVLRAKATSALANMGDNPSQSLLDFLAAAKNHTKSVVRERERIHRERKGRILKWLRASRSMVGDAFEPVGSLHAIAETEPTKQSRIQSTERRRDQLLDEWAEICRDEQQRWAEDKGFADFVAGESCCRQFFQDKVAARTYSHIDHLIGNNDQRVSGVKSILKYARQHFGGNGSIFNLQTPSHPEHRRTILDALIADGRRLSDNDRDELCIERIFSKERVQQAIDELKNGTQTGEDGWTAEFFKVVGMRQRRDKFGERAPSALARLVSATLLQCTTGGHNEGQMLDIMRTSIVSLIFKDKGSRGDIGKYRPIRP